MGAGQEECCKPPRDSLVPFKPNEKTKLVSAQRENNKTGILMPLMAAGQRSHSHFCKIEDGIQSFMNSQILSHI